MGLPLLLQGLLWAGWAPEHACTPQHVPDVEASAEPKSGYTRWCNCACAKGSLVGPACQDSQQALQRPVPA